MKTQIIAIGGGAMSNLTDKFPLEKYILEQTGKEVPKVCFLGTATGDADHNIVRFYEVFRNFPCECTHLSLFNAPDDIEAMIMKQDVVYVGGGNTRNLLALWREWGLDKIFYKAWQNGTIMTGFSAGSLCWYEEGLSDYIISGLNSLKGLGFIKGSHCPHYDSESKRRPRYRELIRGGIMQEGVAADDDVALHYIDGKLEHIISSNRQGKAYEVKKVGDKVQEIVLKPDIFVK